MGKGVQTGVLRWVRSGVFFVFSAAVLVACGDIASSPTLTTTGIPSTPTAEITLTASLELPSETPPTPTLTLSPSATAALPGLSTTTSYSIPDWMKMPQADILMQWIRKVNDPSPAGTLSFLNPETGEWADLPFPADATYYFWFDNMHFGFLPKNLDTLYLFDTGTGQVSTQPVLKDSTRFIEINEYGPEALLVKRWPSSPDKYYFDYVDLPNSRYTSRLGRYSASTDWDSPGNSMTITDTKTGKIVWESEQGDGLWESEFAWSPHWGSYIAFVRGSPDGESSSLITRNSVLEVYDVNEGKRILEYKADIGNIKWSPDGSRILYQSLLSRYATLGHAFVGAPCIFDILSLQNRCLLKIPQAPIPAGYKLETTGLYSWSPDGQSIRYIYLFIQPETGAHLGKVCILGLVNGNIFCPTENLVEPKGWGISYYDFSPDGRFINFCYSESDILSDHIGSGYDALISVTGSGFTTWTGLGEGGSPQCSYFQQIWRPLP